MANLQEEQHEEESNHVPTSIPAERSGLPKRLEKRRPRDRQHKVKEPTRRSCQRHPLGTNVQRVCFCRVREWHRTLTDTVDDGEEVNSERHTGDSRITGLWN